jgi:twinkle protein
MKKWKQAHLPCPKCDSSDAFAVDKNGKGYCFSCETIVYSDDMGTRVFESMGDSREELPDVSNYSYEYLPWRSISKDTMRFFDVKTKVLEGGKPHSIQFPYGDTASKLRLIDEKEFWAKGAIAKAGLFGKDKFSAGSSRAVTIVEGETDTLSTFQMLGSKYAVLGVQSSTTALRDCTTDYDYLNSFDQIYLCFDNDEHGKKAAKQVSKLFNYSKVFHVKLTLKDPTDYLQAGKIQDFRNIWYNSKKYLPDNIVSSLDDFKKIIAEDRVHKGTPYPWDDLNAKTQGVRTSEIVLVTALEGVGKTEFIRAIEHKILKDTDDNIAIIHLEENRARALKGLAGLELGQPVHIADPGVSDDEITASVDTLVRRHDRLYVYSHFGSDDPDVILGNIRFLVSACGCRYVFLDHITMVVSGRGEDDRLPLDELSTKLSMLVEELDFALVLVSHVNDNGKTRGSRNISKIASTWIELRRDLEADTEDERNVTYLTIKKNRFFGETGPAGKLVFDRQRFKLCSDGDYFKMPPVGTASHAGGLQENHGFR